MTGRRAAQVASGIFLSRLTGLIRERVAAHFLGVSALGDVFAAVFRGPNLVQNLLGEQSLSASFIPIYVRKLALGQPREAVRFASVSFALLAVTAAGLTLAGVLLAVPLVALLNPGMLQDAAAVAAGDRSVDRFPLVVAGVRIVFPMVGLLVLSAWCLGVLNSHRRFFLSYVAPVLWNGAIIVALLWVGGMARRGPGQADAGLVLAACVGALVGAGLQLGIQLPAVLQLLPGFNPRLSLAVDGVQEAISRFGPAVAGRSAAQLSGYVDLVLASFFTVGTLAALGWAQRLYLLPIALFGLSIAAAELPELARLQAAARAREVPLRFAAAFRRMLFFVVPTVVGFVALGYLMVGLLYRGGSFGVADNLLVYGVLGGYALGLPATITGRLLHNVFYAMGDTRTPARIAFLRLGVAAALGAATGYGLDQVSLYAVVPVDGAQRLSLAPVGMAVASAGAAWLELSLLRRRLRMTSVAVAPSWSAALGPLAAATVAAAAAGALWWALRSQPVALLALVVLPVYGALYLVAAWRRSREELRALWEPSNGTDIEC